MSLGETLSSLRKQANMTQEEVAIQLHVSRQTISNWESDQAAPNIEKAKDLSVLFHISLDSLLNTQYEQVPPHTISNAQKLAGLVYRILKWIAVGAIIALIINIVSTLLFHSYRSEVQTTIEVIEINE